MSDGFTYPPRSARMGISMRFSRKFVLCVALGSLFCEEMANRGNSTELHSPQHVFARNADVSLWEGNRALTKAIPGLMYEVIKQQGTWIWTGRGWLRQEDVVRLEDAVSFYRSGPDPSETYFALVNRARARYELRDYSAAVMDCVQALKGQPDGVAALSMRGRILLRINRRDEALADLAKAIRLDPTFALAYATRAHAWIEQGDLTNAVEDANRAIELDPRSAWALAARGKVMCRLAQYDRAIADYDQALKINPNLHAVWNNRGNAHLKKGDFNQAVADYSVALKLAPSAQVYFNRAVAWSLLGQLDRSQEDHSQSAKMDPKFAPAELRRSKAVLQPET